MNTVYFASVIALLAAGACYWVIRRLMTSRPTAEDLNDWIDMNWQSSRPIERLLSPTEFDFLRRRGMSKERINQLRTERRKLFRMYLRRLRHEFNTVHAALQAVMVDSAVDRPDLARELGKQRMLFYRYLAGVEVKLAFNAMGLQSVPSLELIRPLERLHVEFMNLAPAMSGAQA